MSEQGPSVAEQLKTLQDKIAAEEQTYCQDALARIQALADELGVEIVAFPVFTADGRISAQCGIRRKAAT